MKWSYQIGSIRGIPIRLHVTFLVILVFFIWAFAVQDHKIEEYVIIIGFGGLQLENEGKTVITIAIDGKIQGMIAIADRLKETTGDAIKELKRMGFNVVMITGDNSRKSIET